MTAISRNMPLASPHSAFGIRHSEGGREGGRYAEKHRGKILEKKRATRCRRTDADGRGGTTDGWRMPDVA